MKRPALPDPDGIILRDDGKEFLGNIQHSDNGLFVESWNIDESGEWYIIDEIPLDKIASIRQFVRIKRNRRKS